jgi:hypothetical protein
MKRTIPLYPGAWPQCIAAAMQAIRELPGDRTMVVTISERKRTSDQNSKWHAMAGELAQELGYTPEELKRLAKHELGRYVVIDGPIGKIKRLQSSADWDVTEMSEAIELLHRWAAEVGHRWRVE